MKCGNCHAKIDVDALASFERLEIIRELEAANTRDRFQARSEQPPLAVDFRGVRVRGVGLSRTALAITAAAIAAFLLFDDIKWHALFPVGVAAFWLFSCWLDYANERDAAKLGRPANE